MLKRRLSKLDDAFGRPDTDVLARAVQVLHKRFRRLTHICFEGIKGSFNYLISFRFRLSSFLKVSSFSQP